MVTLEGDYVRLVPLGEEHYEDLVRLGSDAETWKWVTVRADSPALMRRYLDDALKGAAEGKCIPFLTVGKRTGVPVGSTRFMNIEPTHRRVEIGSTWIAPPWQRTAINTEAKLLMLRYAFEKRGCVRVELKTDALNEKSRNAIKRLGAKEEGTLRKHFLCHGDRWRDTVYYSILENEWSDVQARLVERLKRPKS